MRALVRFRLPDGREHDLHPGDFVGRSSSAALYIDDARISEAHALVSLRGRELRFLQLRGRFALDGQQLGELTLREGLLIELAQGLTLEVLRVQLPPTLLALKGEGLPTQALHEISSLIITPRPRVVSGRQPSAAACLWSTDGVWRAQIGDADPVDVQAGDHLTVEGLTFSVIAITLDDASRPETCEAGGISPPLTIIAHFETVHIHVEGQPALALSGLPARIISELVSFGGPVHWEVLAGELWRDDLDRMRLRQKLDVNLSRLRSKLRGGRIRPDLVRSDGAGQIEIFLDQRDRVDDRT